MFFLEKVLVFFLFLFFVAGCTLPTENNGGVEVELDESDVLLSLEGDTDFNDWKDDFISGEGREPVLVLIKKERLSEEIIGEKIGSASVGQKNIVERIFSDLDVSSGNIFYVEMKDKVLQNRGVIAIIDGGEKKVLKFFATLGIVVS